jgi:hypothetical protein
MRSRLLTAVLLVGVLLAGISLFQAARGSVRLAGNDKGYQPIQPIAYSHQVHAGNLAIPCLYCHSGAEKSRRAGVPSASVCMNCHRYVTAALGVLQEEEQRAQTEGREPRAIVSAELAKLYAAQGLGEDLQPEPELSPMPIAWKRVHSVPDFVAFDHRPHVAADVGCQRCHGAIEAMDRVRQESTLSMGWCVECHRTMTGRSETGRPVDPPLDCATCHY